MTEQEKTVLIVKGLIFDLSPPQRAACLELADQLRQTVERAGKPIGALALWLVGAEAEKIDFKE